MAVACLDSVYVTCYGFVFVFVFLVEMCLVGQKTVWEKKSFVFGSESTRLLLNLTNYDLILLALLASNYYKIGHKSDCFAYSTACLMSISIFEVLKVLHFRSKYFPFFLIIIFLL